MCLFQGNEYEVKGNVVMYIVDFVPSLTYMPCADQLEHKKSNLLQTIKGLLKLLILVSFSSFFQCHSMCMCRYILLSLKIIVKVCACQGKLVTA